MKTDKFRILPSKPYSITINPAFQGNVLDRLEHRRLQEVKDHIHDIIRKCHSLTYKIHYEISDPQKLENGKCTRIHAHGIIVIHDLLEFLLYDYNVLAEKADIFLNTIDDTDHWNNYCLKQQEYLPDLGCDFTEKDIVQKELDDKREAERNAKFYQSDIMKYVRRLDKKHKK